MSPGWCLPTPYLVRFLFIVTTRNTGWKVYLKIRPSQVHQHKILSGLFAVSEPLQQFMAG